MTLKSTLALAALTLAGVSSPSHAAMMIDAARPAKATAIEQSAFFYGGRQYCWYADGWRGPGWYRCGFSARQGLGWGGADGWLGYYGGGGYRGGHGRFGGRHEGGFGGGHMGGERMGGGHMGGGGMHMGGGGARMGGGGGGGARMGGGAASGGTRNDH